jgi:uncharacterized membrane protein
VSAAVRPACGPVVRAATRALVAVALLAAAGWALRRRGG